MCKYHVSNILKPIHRQAYVVLIFDCRGLSNDSAKMVVV